VHTRGLQCYFSCRSGALSGTRGWGKSHINSNGFCKRRMTLYGVLRTLRLCLRITNNTSDPRKNLSCVNSPPGPRSDSTLVGRTSSTVVLADIIVRRAGASDVGVGLAHGEERGSGASVDLRRFPWVPQTPRNPGVNITDLVVAVSNCTKDSNRTQHLINQRPVVVLGSLSDLVEPLVYLLGI
jgi:hypothetical protein